MIDQLAEVIAINFKSIFWLNKVLMYFFLFSTQAVTKLFISSKTVCARLQQLYTR